MFQLKVMVSLLFRVGGVVMMNAACFVVPVVVGSVIDDGDAITRRVRPFDAGIVVVVVVVLLVVVVVVLVVVWVIPP